MLWGQSLRPKQNGMSSQDCTRWLFMSSDEGSLGIINSDSVSRVIMLSVAIVASLAVLLAAMFLLLRS